MCFLRGIGVNNSQLHPEYFGSYLFRIVDEQRYPFRILKQVDDIDRGRDRFQIGITFLPEDFVILRIYRGDLETVLEQVFRCKKARGAGLGLVRRV